MIKEVQRNNILQQDLAILYKSFCVFVTISNLIEKINYTNSLGDAVYKSKRIVFCFNQDFNSKSLDIDMDYICKHFINVTIEFRLLLRITKVESINNIIKIIKKICEQIQGTPKANQLIRLVEITDEIGVIRRLPYIKKDFKIDHSSDNINGTIGFLSDLLDLIKQEQQATIKEEQKGFMVRELKTLPEKVDNLKDKEEQNRREKLRREEELKRNLDALKGDRYQIKEPDEVQQEQITFTKPKERKVPEVVKKNALSKYKLLMLLCVILLISFIFVCIFD